MKYLSTRAASNATADRKRFCDIRHRHVVFQEHRQNRPAGRVGKGGESGIKGMAHRRSLGRAGRDRQPFG